MVRHSDYQQVSLNVTRDGLETYDFWMVRIIKLINNILLFFGSLED